MCARTLYSQCETTQVRDEGSGAALFGYSKLYGQVPGGQAEYLRVPQAQFTHISVPHGPPDDRFVYLSDVLPTAWQSVAYAEVPAGGTLVVLGLGPDRGHGLPGGATPPDQQDHRRRPGRRTARPARARGIEVVDLREHDGELGAVIRELTGGRGPDAVIDAIGMEAHGSLGVSMLQQMVAHLPEAAAASLIKNAGIDRLASVHTAVDLVRRGGTVSLIGVYSGTLDRCR